MTLLPALGVPHAGRALAMAKGTPCPTGRLEGVVMKLARGLQGVRASGEGSTRRRLPTSGSTGRLHGPTLVATSDGTRLESGPRRGN